MKLTAALLLLFAGAYIVMMIVRAGARRRARNDESPQDFPESVSKAIREAGSHNHLNPSAPNHLSLDDLWRMRTNMWWYSVQSGIMLESSHLMSEKKHVRMQELHYAIQNESCALTYKLFLSGQEIIRGKFRPDTQYLYTQEVEYSYCVAADILETMADLANKPLAARLRRHLA